ncbi:T9SS type A sorting domain-containing protein, partial [Flavivirga algicola]
TRLDGSGSSPVDVTMDSGGGAPGLVPVDLNWPGVTSFTMTALSATIMAFDNLSVNTSGALSVTNFNKNQKALIYPNPVENVINIKNVSDLKLVGLYNNLGQYILQSKRDSIDMSHLQKGMYFLKIHTGYGIEIRKIIKK